MKKYILGFALLAGLALTSCNKDNEGAIYQPSWQNVSFEMESPNQILTQDASITIPVRLIRANTEGAYTAHYTLASETEGIFTDNNSGQVTFEVGKNEAFVNLSAANMKKGNLYEAVLTLSDADVAQNDTITGTAVNETKISIMCDYNWVSAGTCTFTDFNFSESDDGDSAKGVEILNGEGSNVYRIVSPLYTVYGDKAFLTNAPNIDFYLNADGSISLPEGQVCDMAGYWLYMDTKNYGGYCFVEQSGNTYVVHHLLLQGSSLYIGQFMFTWNK